MCTGIYIGKKVSKDGSVMLARSCDHAKDLNMTTTLMCYPHKDNANNEYIEALMSGIKYPLPKTQYKNLSTPCLPSELGSLTSIAANEFGLAVTGTVTAYTSPNIKEIDPFEELGVTEDFVAAYAGITSKTAREGIVKITELVEKFGSNDAHIIMFADQKES